MAAGIVVVVVIVDEAVLRGKDSRDGGFAGPLTAADPESVLQGRERVPRHGKSVNRTVFKIKSCSLIIWRPADTEVWATTPDGVCEQIGGRTDNPFPGLDTGGAPMPRPIRTIIETLFHGRSPR
jgi:hypothetical protein